MDLLACRTVRVPPPDTSRADGHSPFGLRLAKRPARGATGCAVPISNVNGFVRRTGRRWRARASARARRACSLSDARAACITEPPIPLEGGLRRGPEHNARGLCELGFAKLAAAARIIRAMFKCPQQRARTHTERCGSRRQVVRPVRSPSGAPEEARLRAPLPREEQRPRQSRKAALVTDAADPKGIGTLRRIHSASVS